MSLRPHYEDFRLGGLISFPDKVRIRRIDRDLNQSARIIRGCVKTIIVFRKNYRRKLY